MRLSSFTNPITSTYSVRGYNIFLGIMVVAALAMDSSIVKRVLKTAISKNRRREDNLPSIESALNFSKDI